MINEIFFKILEFSSNKNLIIINTSFYSFIKNLRKKFINKPLIIKYKLKRIKKKMYSGYRASFYVEPENQYILDNKTFGINIGKIDYENIIKPSKIFEDVIIPLSFSNNLGNNSIIIYFEIYQVYTDDIIRFKHYCLLNYFYTYI